MSLAPFTKHLLPDEIPGQLPLVPLRADVLFPGQGVDAFFERPVDLRVISAAIRDRTLVAFFTQRVAADQDPKPAGLFTMGAVARITSANLTPEGKVMVRCVGTARARLVEAAFSDGI